MPKVHRYATQLSWSGSTAGGYRAYDRNHTVFVGPGIADLEVTADPSFGGDPTRLNPEQLLLVAASSCQALSFFALAAREGIDVVGYDDEASAEMPVTREPMRIATITLRPRIEVAPGTDAARVVELVHRGHEECFIANTLSAEMIIEPQVVERG